MEIRQATINDALFVAKCVSMALHTDMSAEELNHFAEVCRLDDVLYSYRNAIIAEIDNVPAGLCLAYDGNNYHEIRVRTFAHFPELSEKMDFENFEDETHEGEFYIDSLAVLPEFRRRGIAQELMKAQIKRGHEMGLPVAALLVDPENPNAQKLYYNLGFKYSEDIYAFGQIFWKLSMPTTT